MIKATLSFIKVENFCYTTCPLKIGDRHCKKKVNTNENGQWYCGRCDKTFPKCDDVTKKELNILKHEKQDDVKFSHII